MLPKVPDAEKLKSSDEEAKRKQKDYDRHHRVNHSSPLSSGDRVWIPDLEAEAVVNMEVAPRSYKFMAEDGSTVR